MFVRTALGRSGRKRARRAQQFLGGSGGFLTASTVLAAAGVAWGIYDSLRAQQAAEGARPGPAGPAVDVAFPPPTVPPEVARIVRLAASAANCDGALSPAERAVIVARAKQAGVAEPADAELRSRQPLADIIAGVTGDAERRDLYVLAFAIVRADEGVSGSERIYLAQLAHALGLSPDAVAGLEGQTSAAIDAAGPTPA